MTGDYRMGDYRTGDGQIDWQAVHRRMAEVAQAIDQAERLSPEAAQALLDDRARRLAVAPDDAPSAGEILEVLNFRVDGMLLAIEARLVLEVLRTGELTPLPHSPDFVQGVTNLRGEILAVFDVRHFFGGHLPDADQNAGQVVVQRSGQVLDIEACVDLLCRAHVLKRFGEVAKSFLNQCEILVAGRCAQRISGLVAKPDRILVCLPGLVISTAFPVQLAQRVLGSRLLVE